MDIPGTHRRAMGTRAILVVLVTPAPPPMDTKAIRITPLRPAMGTRAMQATVRQVTDIEAVSLNRGSAWAFSCLAASDGTASRRRGREHGTWTALLPRKLGMRIGSCVTHPRQPVSYCDGNSEEQSAYSLLFRPPTRQKSRISAAHRVPLAVNFIEKQRRTAKGLAREKSEQSR